MRRHTIRRSLVAAAIAGTGLLGALGAGSTAHAATLGRVNVITCSSVSGTTTYQPGLLAAKDRNVTASVSATLAGCSSVYTGPIAGAGTFTARVSGSADLANETFGSGSFVINWPVAAGLNPSVGSGSISDAAGTLNIGGTITAGAYTGAPAGFSAVDILNTGKGTKRHPVTAQQFTNTTPLTVSVNEG